MVDYKLKALQTRLFIVEFKRVMLIGFLFLLSIGLGTVVRSYYPETSPLSYYELQKLLPPIFFIIHITAQIASFLLIFLAGYFIAAYRIEWRTRRCQILENTSSSLK
ncbi:MAG: hypothetical protein ACFE9L_05850 [Candidatus Hodarchaeota archaeon]